MPPERVNFRVTVEILSNAEISEKSAVDTANVVLVVGVGVGDNAVKLVPSVLQDQPPLLNPEAVPRMA